MPIQKYPFMQITPGDIPRPYLPIEIHNPHTGRRVRTLGLIDTGADDCALPAKFASILGHDLMKGIEKKISTGNGTTAAYAHITRIDIHTQVGSAQPVYTIPDTPIDFMPNLHVVLLGTRNFLSRFILEVNYPELFFSLTNSHK